MINKDKLGLGSARLSNLSLSEYLTELLNAYLQLDACVNVDITPSA